MLLRLKDLHVPCQRPVVEARERLKRPAGEDQRKVLRAHVCHPTGQAFLLILQGGLSLLLFWMFGQLPKQPDDAGPEATKVPQSRQAESRHEVVAHHAARHPSPALQKPGRNHGVQNGHRLLLRKCHVGRRLFQQQLSQARGELQIGLQGVLQQVLQRWHLRVQRQHRHEDEVLHAEVDLVIHRRVLQPDVAQVEAAPERRVGVELQQAQQVTRRLWGAQGLIFALVVAEVLDPRALRAVEDPVRQGVRQKQEPEVPAQCPGSPVAHEVLQTWRNVADGAVNLVWV
mmetsp:Transcript_62153/g.148154  ORF Transcript_62153/g.148154 Transcript_62153/m.148154 type:complete len:286 (+) Transcript_62153:2452-3309(+)